MGKTLKKQKAILVFTQTSNEKAYSKKFELLILAHWSNLVNSPDFQSGDYGFEPRMCHIFILIVIP